MKPKSILITGATAGIGRHAALELVRQGHHVIATGRRESVLLELKDEAAALGAGLLDIVQLDVTSEDDVSKAQAAVAKLTAGRGIDVLVNNAGYGQMGPIESVSDADLRRQFDTNVFGLMSVTRAFVGRMRERGEGRIINIGSISGRVTAPFTGAYSATKYAVRSISDALRVELGAFGLSVSLIEPGPIRTAFNERAVETIDPRSLEESPYSVALAKADRLRHRFDERAVGPEVTTAAIVHAATARRPRARYVVPRRASILLCAVAMAPTRFVDAIMRAFAGLTKSQLPA